MSRLPALPAAALMTLALAQAPAAYAQASASPYTSGTRYDLMHRVTGAIAPDPDGAGGLHHPAARNTYDAAGRLIRVETGELSAWQSEAVAPSAWTGFSVFRKLDTQYDAMGRKLRDTLSSGAGVAQTVTQYSYDAMGRPECTAVRMNAADFASPPASACTQGTGGADRITRSVYDASGQRLQLREGVGTADEGTEATWAYSANGKVTTVIDGNGNRATLVYDGHDRQECWMFPSTARAASFNDASQATALATAGALSGTISGGHCVSGDYEGYTADPNGNRLTLRKRDAQTIVYGYDHLNRIILKDIPGGTAADVYYDYDARGHQTSALFGSTSGQGITNVWDGFGALTSASTNMGGVARTLTYRYDPDGARTRITHPDGEWFQQDHDGLDRPTMLSRQAVPGLALLVYDATGLPYVMGLGNGYNRFFGYDAVQRITSFSHDLAGTSADASWTFPRNAAGQIASVTRDNDAYAWTGHYAVQRPYTTNGLNQYSAAGGTALAYDTNGNLISETTAGVTKTYTYDAENRLVATSIGAALSYDPLGRLYQVSLGGSTTTFLYDGNALVAEYDSAGTLTRRYVHGEGADVPLVQYNGTDPNQIRFLYGDQQGSIVAMSNGAGTMTAIDTYDEYGIPGATNQGRFQYTGQAWLAELGMYYYKARIYSPTLGRFLQTDPIGYADQYNLYEYVGDDPVDHSDPTGKTIQLSGTADAQRQFINLAYRLTGVHLRQTSSGRLEQVGSRNSRVGNGNAAHTLIHALNSRSNIPVIAVSQDRNVVGDSFVSKKFDVGDYHVFEGRSSQFAAGLFAHVLAERDFAIAHGIDISHFSIAHQEGLRAEMGVMGAAYRTTPPAIGALTFDYFNSRRELMASYRFRESAVGTLPW